MNQIQLIISTVTPFQKLDYRNYSQMISNSWLQNIWEYRSSRNVSFDLTTPTGISPQRSHDKTIIDVLFQHFSCDDIAKINKIRIRLRLLTLADITDAAGKCFYLTFMMVSHIDHHYLNGRVNQRSTNSFHYGKGHVK